MLWYKQTLQDIYAALDSSDDGISQGEQTHREKHYGPNQLSVKKDSLWRTILEPFRNIFIAVLLVAAAVSLASHEVLDAIIIAVIICINAAVYYIQTYTTHRVLRSLKKRNVQKTTVLQNSKPISILSTRLVPGDVIIIEEGERVPADARIIHADNIRLNESALTGESTPVHKRAALLTTDKPIYEQENMLFQGTYVTTGSARAIVVATGDKTEFGKIAALTQASNPKSTVQKRVDRLISILIRAIACVAIVVLGLALWRGMAPQEAIRFVLSLSVSAVPESLPVALTIVIVFGMRRMAKKKALVRSFKAIEDIGLVTAIATDKTGTLTRNHLTIKELWSPSGKDIRPHVKHTVSVDTRTHDPLDLAIIEVVGGVRLTHHDHLYPFDTSLRMSGIFVRKDSCIYIKGSPEHILATSHFSGRERHAAESVLHELAAQGNRVIAIAACDISVAPVDLSQISDRPMRFVGFVAFADQPRPEAITAIKQAHSAGIAIKMITGDHYETAYNIGKQILLAEHPGQVIQGVDLPKNERALQRVVAEKSVFARVLPQDKFRILQALKDTDNITAMTGDGVNDVPALASAHVGIAMGSGSDIAKDAGGIVLLDDNFASIIKAVGEGRRIYDNIRKMLFYLLATTIGEIMTMVGALLFGLPLPVTAIQILWINLVTDTSLVIPLGLEPEEDGNMKRPPRQPHDPILGRILVSRIVIVAVVMAICALSITIILQAKGYSTAYIQTVAFMALISAQWANVFNARSEYTSSFKRIRKPNHALTIGFLVAFTLQALVMFTPFGELFGVEKVAIGVVAIASLATAAAVLVAVEFHKIFVRIKT